MDPRTHEGVRHYESCLSESLQGDFVSSAWHFIYLFLSFLFLSMD